MSQRRIAFVTQSAPGAFTRISAWLREAFEQLEVPFDVVFLEGSPTRVEFGSTREIFLGVDYARRSIPALTRYLRSERPSMVFSSPEFISPYVLIAAGLSGRTPAVPWEANLYPEGLSGFPLRKRLFFRELQLRTYGSAPVVACVSRGVADYVTRTMKPRIGPGRVVVIPNPIDANAIRSEGWSPSSSNKTPFLFCASGRLNRQKGMDLLVQAAAELRRLRPTGWSIRILGRGHEEPTLRSLIEELHLGHLVQLEGFVQSPYRTMGAANCFVHPARWEGFGLVLAEAMALGVPVVATACPGGPQEILAGGKYGLLVPPEDPSALSQAMLQMMESASVREELSSAARESLERYDPQLVAQMFCDLCERVRSHS